LFRSAGSALFGLFVKIIDGRLQFLVRLTEEIGCFDTVELGPSVFLETTEQKRGAHNTLNAVEMKFREMLEQGIGILADVMLSEEGGRFYYEENRNVIIYLSDNDPFEAPQDYFWQDYGQLNRMVKYNNVLNIQLRNLISLIQLDMRCDMRMKGIYEQ
jgi:oxidase EvaA